MRVEFVKFSNAAICPTKGSSDAAGFDLCSVKDVLVPLSTVKLLRADIGLKIPRGYFGKIHPQSSFALRFTDVCGGVIDADYRDLVSLIFLNFSPRFVETE